MRIIHLSDLHLTDHDTEIWGVNPQINFAKSLDKIAQLNNIDAIIVSGDISNDGSLWSYEYFDNEISKLKIPTYCCMGNHDSLEVMNGKYKAKFYKYIPQTIINDWNFIFINSIIEDDIEPNKNKARGAIKKNDLLYIENELKKGLPSCIVFHQPPLEPGGWLNKKILDNRDAFNKIIYKYDNAKLVLYGHIHCSIENRINGIVYSSSPSTAFAFDKDLPAFQISPGKEGFNMITISNNEIAIETINI